MNNPSLSQPASSLRVFNALLLSFLIITMPFAQMAARANAREAGGRRQEADGRRQTAGGRRQTADSSRQNDTLNAAAENLFVNGPIPEPAPQPLTPIVAPV